MPNDELHPDNEELSQDELAQQNAEELPERDNMSLVNLNAAVPINAAAALNVLSDDSTAVANATIPGTSRVPDRTSRS
jgi:hypothetical protein